MKSYTVYGTITLNVTVDIEADNPGEAHVIAGDMIRVKEAVIGGNDNGEVKTTGGHVRMWPSSVKSNITGGHYAVNQEDQDD